MSNFVIGAIVGWFIGSIGAGLVLCFMAGAKLSNNKRAR